MKKNKAYALELLNDKRLEKIEISYEQIARLTGYSRRHLIRLFLEIEKRDIESAFSHGSKGKTSNHSASDSEINFLKEFKKQYPNISITQFMDIYHEDIVFNPAMKSVVDKYNLQERSYTFFKDFFKRFKYKSIYKHKSFTKKDSHPLRDASPYRGFLIMFDGTPHDWFENGQKFSLHLAIDDADGHILAGYFMENECLEGYCHMLKLLIQKHGIPENMYCDRHTIMKSPVEGKQTQFGRICEELGINLIFASSPQAKGKIERMNKTIQNRLLNDIKRYKIKDYDQLNLFFNETYINYINQKFGYQPKFKETKFEKIKKNFDYKMYFNIQEERSVLDGCLISYGNKYYQLLDKENKTMKLYKGTKVKVLEDIFDHTIRLKYLGKLYDSKLVEGHFIDPKKRAIKIQNQKELDAYLSKKLLKY